MFVDVLIGFIITNLISLFIGIIIGAVLAVKAGEENDI